MTQIEENATDRIPPVPADGSGRYLLDAQHGVLLVDTEYHQNELRRHVEDDDSPAVVVAELGIGSPYGAPPAFVAVEARIEGRRIGALPPTDAAWYHPLLARVVRQGLQPTAEGHIRSGEDGELLVELFLPAGTDPESLGPEELPRPSAQVTGPPEPARRSRLPIRAGLLVAALAVLALVGYTQWPRIAEWTGAAPRPAAVDATPAPTSAPAPVQALAPTPAPTTAPAPRVATTSKELPPITNGGCDPNYSGACVPIASHVECAKAGQSGPLLVRGPFRVTGTDLYVLDPDGDGIACAPPTAPKTQAARARSAATDTTTRAPARSSSRSSDSDREGGSGSSSGSDDN